MSAAAPLSISSVLSRILIVPAWLEPRLRALGSAWWQRAARADARVFWRWLAGNWQKVAAWWLTAGLILTALLLLGALVTWQNPQLVLMRLMAWSTELFTAGGRVASVGAALVLVLSLPLILPGALLTLAALLTLTVAVIVFAPVLVVGLIAYGGLLAWATAKRTGGWLSRFIVESLHHSDEKRGLIAHIEGMLGLSRASITSRGESQLMTSDEFARLREANERLTMGGEVFLGTVEGQSFSYRTEKHVFIAAAARSGKGRDLIIPNLHLYPASVFVLDPKGENCNATAAGREARGHTIAAFDPFGLTERTSARFNPIALLSGDDLVTRADYLAEALIIGPSDHWNESARGLIRALALHLATCPQDQLAGRARDLSTLRVWLTGELDVVLEEMTGSTACEGLIARLAESFIGIPPNEKGGIVNTARRDTKWLDNARLAGLFKAGPDCIEFEALREEGKLLSVFVCLPGDLFETYPQVARLLSTFALDTMMKKLTGRQRPVMFILDELAQLGHLPIVQRAFTLGAGYGVQVWAVFQSIEQAKKLYPLDSLYGSSGLRCFFNLADPESVEFASKCASGVLTPADVRRLGPLEMLTLLDGQNPLIVQRLGPQPSAT